jgi:hypothetical protein
MNIANFVANAANVVVEMPVESVRAASPVSGAYCMGWMLCSKALTSVVYCYIAASIKPVK